MESEPAVLKEILPLIPISSDALSSEEYIMCTYICILLLFSYTVTTLLLCFFFKKKVRFSLAPFSDILLQQFFFKKTVTEKT